MEVMVPLKGCRANDDDQVALPDGTPVQIPLSAELEPNQTLVVPVKARKKCLLYSICI